MGNTSPMGTRSLAPTRLERGACGLPLAPYLR